MRGRGRSHDVSIRTKLIAGTMVACAAAVLVACTGFALYDLASARRGSADEVDAFANMLALNGTAAVSFADPKDAASVLSSLRAEEEVEAAGFYLADALDRVRGQSVLVVGDGDDVLDAGGTVRLFREDNRVRFEVSLKAADRAGLRVSSRLLKLAKIYDR